MCAGLSVRSLMSMLVMVNDYHLMLLPHLIREKIPDATIGFFLHVTFPSSEIVSLSQVAVPPFLTLYTSSDALLPDNISSAACSAPTSSLSRLITTCDISDRQCIVFSVSKRCLKVFNWRMALSTFRPCPWESIWGASIRRERTQKSKNGWPT